MVTRSYSHYVAAVQAVSPSMTYLHSFVLKQKIISAFYAQWNSNKNMGMHSEFISENRPLTTHAGKPLGPHKSHDSSNMNLSTDMNNHVASIIIR